MATNAEWFKRIDRARQRRDERLRAWAFYARLHTGNYRAAAALNDDRLVELPEGDQVKVGLIYRMIEQTLALLETPEILITAEAALQSRALTREDTHREAVVGQVVGDSIQASGLLCDGEDIDPVKRDGLLIGHGVTYTHFEEVREDVAGEPIPLFAEQADGSIAPELDEAGAARYEFPTEQAVVYERIADEHCPVTEFLFDARARRIDRSPWHGWEKIATLASVRANPRYSVPPDLKGTAIRRRDLYGQEEDEAAVAEADSVRLIFIYEIATRTLLTFIESSDAGQADMPPAEDDASRARRGDRTLHRIREERHPVRFQDPNGSPFNAFIPIPAQDDPFGISQVEHARVVAAEADKVRTRAANLTRQLKLVLLFQEGRLDEEQLNKALKSPDAEAVGIRKPDDVPWSELFTQLVPAQLPRELYEQIKMAAEDVRMIEGVAEVPFGGADTATESENMMEVGGARPRRKRRRLLDFIATVAARHADFLRVFAPRTAATVVIGADGTPLVLEYGRDAFADRYTFKALPGGETTGLTPVEAKTHIEVANLFLGRFSPTFDRIFARQVLTKLRFRDVNAMLEAMEWPGGVPPNGQAGGPETAGLVPGDTGTGQAIRAATNMLNEGSAT